MPKDIQETQAFDALKKIEGEMEAILDIYGKTKAEYNQRKKLSIDLHNKLVEYTDQFQRLTDSIKSKNLEKINNILSELPKKREEINKKLIPKKSFFKGLSREASKFLGEKKDLKDKNQEDKYYIDNLLSTLQYLSNKIINLEGLEELRSEIEPIQNTAPPETLNRNRPTHEQIYIAPTSGSSSESSENNSIITEAKYTFATDLDLLENSFNKGGIFTRQPGKYGNFIYKRVPIERSNIGKVSIELDGANNIVSISSIGRDRVLNEIIKKIKNDANTQIKGKQEKDPTGKILREYLIAEQLKQKSKFLKPFYRLKGWLSKHLSSTPVKYILSSGETYASTQKTIDDIEKKKGILQKLEDGLLKDKKIGHLYSTRGEPLSENIPLYVESLEKLLKKLEGKTAAEISRILEKEQVIKDISKIQNKIDLERYEFLDLSEKERKDKAAKITAKKTSSQYYFPGSLEEKMDGFRTKIQEHRNKLSEEGIVYNQTENAYDKAFSEQQTFTTLNTPKLQPPDADRISMQSISNTPEEVSDRTTDVSDNQERKSSSLSEAATEIHSEQVESFSLHDSHESSSPENIQTSTINEINLETSNSILHKPSVTAQNFPGIENLFTKEGNTISEKPFLLIHKLMKTHEDKNFNRLLEIKTEIEKKIKEVENLSDSEKDLRAKKLIKNNKEVSKLMLSDFKEKYTALNGSEMINKSHIFSLMIKNGTRKKTFHMAR